MMLMRTRSRTKAIARAAVGGLLGLMLVVAAGGAAMAGDDDDDDTIEMKAIKSIMRGLGANVDGASIDYRERSPLVIPPTRDLPPPQEAATISNPAWPKDPDVVKPAKKSTKAFVNGSIASQAMESPERERPISPDALRKGALPKSEGVTAPDPEANKDPGHPLLPSQLGFTNNMFGDLFGYKAQQTPFTGEPARTNLAQPPAGYQTPSSNYPYGIGVKGNNSTKDLPMVKDRAVGGD
jgi:hypothetical protein